MKGVAAAIGVVLVAALASCGGTGPSAVVIVGAAQSKTEAARTARITFSVALQGQTIETQGIADLANSEATYTTKLPGLGTIQAIQDGTILYEKLPAHSSPTSQSWIKFDIARGLHELTGVDTQFFSQSASTDPAASLDYLRGVSRDTHKVGSDTLRGTVTTHYQGALDLTLAAENAISPTRKTGLRQLVKLLGVSSFTVDVWIDRDGRLRQMRYSLDASKFNLPASAGPKPTGTATYTFEFFDFGVAFSMPSLPSTDHVVDLKIAAAATLVAKGLQEQAAGDLASAKRDYTQAIVDDPHNKFAYYNLGLIQQTAGDNAAAESNYRLALNIDSKFSEPLYNLAILRAAANSIPEAIDLYRRAIASSPKPADAHFNLGLLLRQTGNTTAGNLEVQTAVKLDPSLASRAAAQGVPLPGK